MDLFSSIPDELLCHILSFLTTKEAALTSVLSKRWLNLFALVPSLDIDEHVLLYPEEGKWDRAEIKQSFIDFVDRVLELQGDSPIKKFSIKYVTDVDPDRVNRWICNVLQRGVSDLVISGSYCLPNDKYVNLKLRRECGVSWWDGSEGTFLPMLKTLYIDTDFSLYGKIEMFLSSYPVLEELGISYMEWIDLNVSVSSASLRKLSIHTTGCEMYVNPKSISFDTPNLLYLNYSDVVAEDYPVVNMKNILEARINLMLMEDQIERVRAPNNDWLEDNEVDEDDVVLRFGKVVKLMNGIQNVQKLYLSADTLEVLSLCGEAMPVFNNLKMLAIESAMNRGWQAMPVLLRNCPHLETLVLEGLLHFVTDKCGDACDCASREDKGRSLASCPIKMLEVKGFRGTMREIRMIKHFLNYFPCLMEMKIYVEENDPTGFKFPERFEFVTEIIELYNKLSSCNVQLLVS